MQPEEPQARALVDLARAKARKLLDALEQAAVDAAKPGRALSSEAMAAGSQALQNAMDAARRTLEALDAAAGCIETGTLTERPHDER